ncbi:hypothetical protein LTR62_004223 [Meristemomyces frigidus]|uniref:PH domain-containing protein n=1 Tax=Meristemomyces frigidus TaxID=1508187 RepID=A0AAN7TE70_9PEZI|nr:hypothetical protein LTR62_004223 [Meristemomyces frigidus]
MIQTHQPPQTDLSALDTPPELQPIFTYLNSHSNKLYQEGYFLKLHDLDSRGRPSPARIWVECFAQLVGTVLSLWDAAALDAAGEDGEVVPTFINLSDASIKMIESLPMNGAQGGSLQNVLSISTAANNRYLLHFNSLNSLTQWTAGIRLAMFEHSTLQEAYTGSLIAGKGKMLNNIRAIMTRSPFPHEDWARVRFGAGTAWKRCWCVVTPPEEKEYNKAVKDMKKNSAYERAKLPKGVIKFYDTRRVTKKTRPIATITDAYAAYAIYPQSKPLIDQSTLVKLEGLVTLHGSMEQVAEGFVFVMPEVHAAVTGFEMMLRWLFPVFDTFNLYGRPTRLIADTLDQRGLMFAMPQDRRYGYLDILDVSGLIHTQGSQAWSERQWRREMKQLTSTRMASQAESPQRLPTQRRNTTTGRTSMTPTKSAVQFELTGVADSAPGSRSASPVPFGGSDSRFALPKRTDSAPPGVQMTGSPHKRSASDAQGYKRYDPSTPSRLSYDPQSTLNNDDDEGLAPPPPRHGGLLTNPSPSRPQLGSIKSGDEVPTFASMEPEAATFLPPPQPVLSPPAFIHGPHSRPVNQPYQAPELRRAHSNVDAATLYQMQDAMRRIDGPEEEWSGELQQRGQQYEPRQQQYEPQQQPPQYQGQTQYNHQVASPITLRNKMPADRSQGLLNDATTNRPRSLRQQALNQTRLTSIEDFPYIGGGGEDGPEVFHDARQMQDSAQQHDGSALEAGSSAVNFASQQSLQKRPSLISVKSSHSIARKPIPRTKSENIVPAVPTLTIPSEPASTPQDHHVDSPDSPLATESFEGALIDSDALERILNDNERSPSMVSTQPDYASIISQPPSGKVEEKGERVRPGKLKTVGDPEYRPQHARQNSAGRLDTWAQEAVGKDSSAMPVVDFGRTLVYRPGLGQGVVGAGNERRRSRSGDRLLMMGGGGDGTPTGVESQRHSSYFASPTADSPGDHTSRIWQPHQAQASPGPGSLTPEQWVQYRAELAAVPQLPPATSTIKRPGSALGLHQRTASSGSAQLLQRSKTKTPPLARSRPPSGDWTQYGAAGTGSQRTPPTSRPQSRGAGSHLNPQSRERSRTPSGDWTQYAGPSNQQTPPSRPHSRAASTYLNQQPASRSRTPSGDWTQFAGPSNQQTPPSRPHSRGAGSYLNPQLPAPQYTTHPPNLTAAEQMHVARATGQPLLAYTSNAQKKSQEQHAPGLFGALAAREREREEIANARTNRQSFNGNSMVAAAIAARERQVWEGEERVRREYEGQLELQRRSGLESGGLMGDLQRRQGELMARSAAMLAVRHAQSSGQGQRPVSGFGGERPVSGFGGSQFGWGG